MKYIDRFKKLRSDKVPDRWTALTNHRAPHKPLLLLAVMDLFAEGVITTNNIEATPELSEIFTLYWSKVNRPDQRSSMAYPFFHLISDGFWHLEALPGKEAILAASRQIRSLSQLHEIVRCAVLDDELYSLFCIDAMRNALRSVLIETYFSPEAQPILIEQSKINIEAFYYSQELLEQARSQQLKEELKPADHYRPAVRDQAFRRAVSQAYDHRCAVCGLRMVTSDGHTAVEAAHIEPWSISHNDDPRNGMALCRLCHWTFDEGLVSVSSAYTVLTSRQISTYPNLPGHLLTLTGRPIIGPEERALWPDLNALAYHRTKCFRTR